MNPTQTFVCHFFFCLYLPLFATSHAHSKNQRFLAAAEEPPSLINSSSLSNSFMDLKKLLLLDKDMIIGYLDEQAMQDDDDS